MHPTLTLSVFAGIAVVLIGMVLYMILYNRGLKVRETTLKQKGRPPLSTDEGIAIATEAKERTGRTGTIN